MNYLEVKELLQAGFTAEEIREMLITPDNNPQNPQVNPQEAEPEAQKIEDCAPDLGQQAAEKTQENDDRFNQLNATMERLIKTIQVSNLNNNSIDAISAKADIDTQVDEIMAGIIRPERKKEV